jgi:thiamine kinase-like enzyme
MTGSINRGPLQDCVFESLRPAGPYPTIAKFHDWFAQLPQQRTLPPEQRFTDPHRSYLPDNGRPTLTHGDLHRGNILISSVGPTRIVGIVDWAPAGWYPDYWEFCKARYTSFFNEEWSTTWIPKFLESREDELYVFSYFTTAIGAV